MYLSFEYILTIKQNKATFLLRFKYLYTRVRALDPRFNVKETDFGKCTLFKSPKIKITMNMNYKYLNSYFTYSSYINDLKDQNKCWSEVQHFAVGNLNAW